MVVMACTRFQLQETLMHDEESEELSLVQVTCLLVLHFIPTKYQNTVKPVLVVTSIKQPTCIKQPEESCPKIHRHIFELY